MFAGFCRYDELVQAPDSVADLYQVLAEMFLMIYFSQESHEKNEWTDHKKVNSCPCDAPLGNEKL